METENVYMPVSALLFFFWKLDFEAVVDSLDEDGRKSLPLLRFEGLGPLHSAAASGNMAVKYLVEQLGFDVDSDTDNQGSGTRSFYC